MKSNRFTLFNLGGRILLNLFIIIVPVVIFSYIYSSSFQYQICEFLRTKLDISDPKLLDQQQKIMEYSFYVYIILIGFIVLAFNTFYSFINYSSGKSESILRIVTSCLYTFWGIVFVLLVIYINTKYKDVLYFIENHDYKSIEGFFENEFNRFVKNTGYYTLTLYLIFILIDIFQWQSVRKYSKREAHLSSQQIWLIDVATIMGILSITLITSTIDITMLDESLDVFVAGSVGMQIILSQIIFFFINARYYYDLYKNSEAEVME